MPVCVHACLAGPDLMTRVAAGSSLASQLRGCIRRRTVGVVRLHERLLCVSGVFIIGRGRRLGSLLALRSLCSHSVGVVRLD